LCGVRAGRETHHPRVDDRFSQTLQGTNVFPGLRAVVAKAFAPFSTQIMFGVSKGLAIIPIREKTRSKCAKRWLTVLRPIKHLAPVVSRQQTEIASFRLCSGPSSLSSGCPVCLGSCPKRSSEQNQVFDQELPGITQDWKTVTKVRGSRR
jgi:hypothetical protein